MSAPWVERLLAAWSLFRTAMEALSLQHHVVSWAESTDQHHGGYGAMWLACMAGNHMKTPTAGGQKRVGRQGAPGRHPAGPAWTWCSSRWAQSTPPRLPAYMEATAPASSRERMPIRQVSEGCLQATSRAASCVGSRTTL